MSAPGHALVGAYALGTLSADEAYELEAHLASCMDCRRELAGLRALHEMMGEVPPEAFLDGPPDGGDLLLQRTLRQVRTEASRGRTRRGVATAAAMVALVVIGVGTGVVIGRQGAGDTGQQALPPPQTSTSVVAPDGTKRASGVDGKTGAHLAATVYPAKGWVRLQVQASGIAAGQRCKLMVVSRGGQQVQFGGWLVSATAQSKGVELDGSALMSPDDVAAVSVVTEAGQTLVSVPIPV